MAIGTTERPVNFSPRMSCPTLPDGRCRKTAGGGDHVDRRCAWGAKRNRAYLPREGLNKGAAGRYRLLTLQQPVRVRGLAAPLLVWHLRRPQPLVAKPGRLHPIAAQ